MRSSAEAPAALPDAAPAVVEEIQLRQDSIPVRGLDRDPHLGARLTEHLEEILGVRARVCLLTAQLHVAYDHTRVKLEDILDAVSELLPPKVPGEDNPRHPLDPDPLRDGMTRSVGAVVAVGVLTLQRLFLPSIVPGGVAGVAALVAGVLNLIQGFPTAREGLRKTLGRKTSDRITNGTALTALATANMPLGLIVAGLEGFVLTEEVTTRRAAWRRYEDNIDTGMSALPGAVIRVEAGARAPRDAIVIEGFGTAFGPEGQQIRLLPGGDVPGGTLLLGGPFVLQLRGGAPEDHLPRPAPGRQDLTTPIFGSRGRSVWWWVLCRACAPARCCDAWKHSFCSIPGPQ